MRFRIPTTFFRPWAYTRVSTNDGQFSPGIHRPPLYRIFLTALFGAAAGMTAVLALSRLFRPQYNLSLAPLDNFQDLNHQPIVYQGYQGPAASSDARAVTSSLLSDSYAVSVAVLGHSILAVNTSARLVLPYLKDRVSEQALCIVRAAGWDPVPVPYIPPPHNGVGIVPRFYDLYSKLNIWGLDKVGIERAVYLDADTLAVRNFDELFDTPFGFGAVQDVYADRGYTTSFNTGVLVFRPSSTLLENMKAMLETAKYPPVEADQAFLNIFFASSVLRLPYVYNANLAIKPRSPEMWEVMKDEMRIIHYTLIKPSVEIFGDHGWIMSYEEQVAFAEESMKRSNGLFAGEIKWWLDAYKDMVQRVDLGACFHNKPFYS